MPALPVVSSCVSPQSTVFNNNLVSQRCRKEPGVKSRYQFIVFSGLLLLLGCGAGIQFYSFAEPEGEDAMLLVGSVIVEDNYYTDEPESYFQEIEVGILGAMEDGTTDGFWTVTDERGYFALGNLPPGRYALKAIRLVLNDGSFLTITNRLNSSGDPFLLSPSEAVFFEGSYFAEEPQNRVVNFHHNHFVLSRTTRQSRIVPHTRMDKISGMKLVTGEEYSAPTVTEYFIEKHPESSWAPRLESL